MRTLTKEYRSWVTAGAYALFDVGIANLSLVGYLFPHWRKQALALAVLPLVYLVISIWLPKSPIFLFKTGKNKEARNVLNRFARSTKKGFSSDKDSVIDHNEL